MVIRRGVENPWPWLRGVDQRTAPVLLSRATRACGAAPGPPALSQVWMTVSSNRKGEAPLPPPGFAAPLAEVVLPAFFPLETIADQPRRPEEGVDALPVGRARGRGVAVPGVGALE